jgi:hypothetical protein
MRGISQSSLFASLGAPLSNIRWSWGSVRPSDGAVFLRVWKDLIQPRNGNQYIRIGNETKLRSNPRNLGRKERMQHILRVANGARCFLIMCEAIDPKAEPRAIKDFNSEHVFPGGKVLEENGEWWVEVLPQVPVKDVTL